MQYSTLLRACVKSFLISLCRHSCVEMSPPFAQHNCMILEMRSKVPRSQFEKAGTFAQLALAMRFALQVGADIVLACHVHGMLPCRDESEYSPVKHVDALIVRFSHNHNLFELPRPLAI